jgi:hypothetical protein
MTSYINVKNKQGLTKLASLIKEAGFHDVKVTIKSKSITLTPTEEPSIQKGLDDLKAGRFISFRNVDEAAAFLEARIENPKKIITRKK